MIEPLGPGTKELLECIDTALAYNPPPTFDPYDGPTPPNMPRDAKPAYRSARERATIHNNWPYRLATRAVERMERQLVIAAIDELDLWDWNEYDHAGIEDLMRQALESEVRQHVQDAGIWERASVD